MGFSVGVLDADIYGPSMPIMFDVESEKPISVTVDGRSKMKPIESYEVKMLSIGFFTAPSQAVIWRGPMASKALNQMIFDADWGALDFMLIDLPPGTGDIHLSIMQSLPITGASSSVRRRQSLWPMPKKAFRCFYPRPSTFPCSES